MKSVLRKVSLTVVVAGLLWLGTASTAEAHRGWRGYGWGGHRGWHGHVGWGHRGWGWGGYRGWGGVGYRGWGWGGYRGWGWGSSGLSLSVGFGPSWGLGYAYSPVYYNPVYYSSPLYFTSPWHCSPASYDVWPGASYSYYAAVPVVINTQRPVVIGPSFAASVEPASAEVPERLPAPSVDARPARVEVVVADPNAEVWFGSHRTRARGLKRVFETPVLQPGKSYSYPVTVQWTENGVAKRETRRVGVQPGSTVVAMFTPGDTPAPPAPGDQPPPVPAGEKQPLMDRSSVRR